MREHQYAESVQVPRCDGPTAVQKRIIGGAIVCTFVWFAVGAAIGKWFYGDVEAGLIGAMVAIIATAVAVGSAALFVFGVALLAGFA